jgi:hypothetical protein
MTETDEITQKIIKDLDYQDIKKKNKKIMIMTKGQWMEVSVMMGESVLADLIIERWRIENKEILSINVLQEIRTKIYLYYEEIINEKVKDTIEKIKVSYLGNGKFLINYDGENHLIACTFIIKFNKYYPENATEYDLFVENIEKTLIKEGLGIDLYISSVRIKISIEEKMNEEYKKSREYKLKVMYK